MKIKTSGKILIIVSVAIALVVGKVFVYDKFYPGNIAETPAPVAPTTETVTNIAVQKDTTPVTIPQVAITETKSTAVKPPKKKSPVAVTPPKVTKNNQKDQAKDVSNNVIPNF